MGDFFARLQLGVSPALKFHFLRKSRIACRWPKYQKPGNKAGIAGIGDLRRHKIRGFDFFDLKTKKIPLKNFSIFPFPHLFLPFPLIFSVFLPYSPFFSFSPFCPVAPVTAISGHYQSSGPGRPDSRRWRSCWPPDCCQRGDCRLRWQSGLKIALDKTLALWYYDVEKKIHSNIRQGSILVMLALYGIIG